MYRALGDQAIPATERLARREVGVTIPEIQEFFQVGKDAARRLVLRLVRNGLLVRTDERRRRPDVYARCPGAGGVVYRTHPDLLGRWRAWHSERSTYRRRCIENAPPVPQEFLDATERCRERRKKEKGHG